MTENVYIIKIKTKPPLSSLYPSERRYSASTVGGMSLVHLILGAMSLLLSTMSAICVPGHVLSLVCLVPSVTGCLAWRRWYIDRNISIFFYGSLFSMVAAILCGVVMIFDITAILSARQSLEFRTTLDIPLHSLEGFNDDHYNITSAKSDSKFIEDPDSPGINQSSKSLTLEPYFNVSGFHSVRNDNNFEESLTLEERTLVAEESFKDDDAMNITESVNPKKKKMAIWRRREYANLSNRILLTLNVLIASSLEMFWSMLSAQIAFHGMMTLPESGNVVAGSKTSKLSLQKRKSPAPKPDILNHDCRLSESLQNFATLQDLTGLGSRLPLPESNREFRERVERFLANQATHRVVEGA
ncbi:uncharacterized protein LOC114941680 [Nylanderia fulva]|uniref:uncharacterized protein LOC114941680 n=1 Tax=Nylanderia fulva TaxID=613905 RepID=UPI0010FB564D|nr:uncharacterized protein LOC114941680 [Nylanderia fulva]XP_029172569.1 uncharacterized protein LOC114941680 [Nylanderia fulva]